MERSGVPYKIVHEGAAFYGPKMDFQIFSSIGRAFTASTNQLDLFMGKKFELEYTANDGTKKTPAVIHRAPLGTHERFIGFLIEHFAGNFPLWLSPVQVKVIPVRENHNDVASAAAKALKEVGLRVDLDTSDTGFGKKVREAKDMKVPYTIIIGDKDVEAGVVTLESRDKGKIGEMKIEDVVKMISEESKTKK